MTRTDIVLLAIAAYLLTPAVRATYIDSVLHAMEGVTLPDPQWAALGKISVTPAVLQWGFRFRLIFFLGPLGLGAFALTRERTKAFFEAVARATERPEEP